MQTGPNQMQEVGKESVLLEHAITYTAIQLYGRQNSSDSAMIIDAMDLLYSDKVDGFVLFLVILILRLAIRLRESGMKVMELANKKTPNSFIVACDFVYIEVLDGAIKKKEPKEQQLMLKKPHQKP
jgi:hypothetical protein